MAVFLINQLSSNIFQPSDPARHRSNLVERWLGNCTSLRTLWINLHHFMTSSCPWDVTIVSLLARMTWSMYHISTVQTEQYNHIGELLFPFTCSPVRHHSWKKISHDSSELTTNYFRKLGGQNCTCINKKKLGLKVQKNVMPCDTAWHCLPRLMIRFLIETHAVVISWVSNYCLLTWRIDWLVVYYSLTTEQQQRHACPSCEKNKPKWTSERMSLAYLYKKNKSKTCWVHWLGA